MKAKDVVVSVGIAIVAFAGGILARQPEVNKLKKQVKNLQIELANKDKLINDANRQNRMLHILLQENQQLKINIGDEFPSYGRELYNYCLLDYFTINVKHLIKQRNITHEEEQFVKSFNKFLNAKSVNDVSQKHRNRILNYIEPKYGKKVLKGQYADLSKIDKLVNEKDIDRALKKLEK